ncbi:FYVE, RhoGEF and PH domain-containing protein 6 [Dermatophagoides farinae]|uniref:FYVE, RhoGEF and PH domain-containing protein 6 n=1 Tax=Dermatophagoides farinae TaxID=6954 RepID=A0A922I4Q6_DERFA|nr:FYVE, RhoGEF and PH domain-containing protein 6 [Dermatophagoides farinae]
MIFIKIFKSYLFVQSQTHVTSQNATYIRMANGNFSTSFISTESTESTSSTESTTFSYSSESNKSLSIPINQSIYINDVDGDGHESNTLTILATQQAPPTPSSQPSCDSLSDKKISDERKKKSNGSKKKKYSLAEPPNEITRPCVDASTPLIGAGGQILSNPSLRENLSSLPKSTPKGGKPDKRYYCAHELYTTERDYVDVLIMLTEEFRKEIQPYVTPKWLSTFFRPLDGVTPINKKLLEELKRRILVDWDDNTKLSDIIIQICPYFKEYSIYIREFDRINFMLDDAIVRFVDFESVLRSFENNDRCRKLTIKSYLLKPIQRLPQYLLMLKQYAKLLDPEKDHDEFEGTQEAMRIVSEVVEHVDRESKMQEQSLTLNELRNRIILTKPTKIIIPGRVLIRRGQLDKVSRKEVHVRYFILFNDVLFYLTPVMNGMYKLKEELPLLGMQVEMTQNYPREFIVRSVKRSFALFAPDEKEREEWVRDLRKAIADHTEKQLSFKNRNSMSEMSSGHPHSPHSMEPMNQLLSVTSSPQSTLSRPNNDRISILSASESDYDYPIPSASANIATSEMSSALRLGDLAPVWLHDNHVTMCHQCTAPFTLLNRRHHCRACGHIFCANCSSHQFPLKYLDYKPDRVCDYCHDELKSMQNPLLSSPLRVSFLNNQHIDSNSDYHDYANIESTPQISVSISPQNSIKSTSSTISSSGIGSGGNNGNGILKNLTRKNRSNSCHELRNNQVKIPPDTPPAITLSHQSSSLLAGGNNHLQQQLLLRNNNIRLSSRLLKNKNVSSVLVEVQANDSNALIAGWLHRYAQKKGWKRYWFVIKNMVLYTFKASEDVRALETLPLLSYDVSVSNESIKGHPAELIIKLSHRCQPTIYFFVEQKEQFQR